MANHLLGCQYVPGNVKTNAEIFKRGKKRQGDDDDEGPSTKRQLASVINKVAVMEERAIVPKTQKQQKFNVIAAKVIPFGPNKQEAFSRQLLRACISAGWSFNSIADPEVQKLFHDYIPGAMIPTRQALSGKILHAEITRVEGEIKNTFRKGAYSVLSGDGWRDLAKIHQIAFTHTVERQVSKFDHS